MVAALVVALILVSLVSTQTPWFKGWLRGYLVDQANRFLHGRLSIGDLQGNLFFGLRLDAVAVELEGERIIAVERIDVDYSVIQIVASGIVIDRIALDRLHVHLRRSAAGWNIGRLIKRQAREGPREGPARPVTVSLIEVRGAALAIDGLDPDAPIRWPRRVDDLQAALAFAYDPVRFTLDVRRLAFRGDAPRLALHDLSGRFAVAGRMIHLDGVSARTDRSAVRVGGQIRRDPGTPAFLQLDVRSDRLSLPELAGVFSALNRLAIEPAVDARLEGPLDRVRTEITARYARSAIAGPVTVDFVTPARRLSGAVTVERLDLAPLLNDAAHRSDISGRVSFELQLPDRATGRPLRAEYAFEGPTVRYVGYDAQSVRARGRIVGARVTFDARLRAYGAAATGAGVIRPAVDEGETVAYDVRGRASGVDLRRLPDRIPVPRLESTLALEYTLSGRGRSVEGRARFGPSQLEGAAIAGGTTAEFAWRPGVLRYRADGRAAGLDLPRLGRALDLDALAADRFRSDLDAEFNLTGAGTTLGTLALAAEGVAHQSRLFDGRLGRVAFTTVIADRALKATATGDVESLDLALATGRAEWPGRISGTVDARVAIADLSREITVDDLEVDGRVDLRQSAVRGLEIDRAQVDGRYAGRLFHARDLRATGPAFALEATGTLALDETNASDVTYRLDAVDLGRLAGLVDWPLAGRATIEGRATGAGPDLVASGRLSGNQIAYEDDFRALNVEGTYAVAIPAGEPVSQPVGAGSSRGPSGLRPEVRPKADTTSSVIARLKAQSDFRAALVNVSGFDVDEVSGRVSYADERLTFDTTLATTGRRLALAGDAEIHPDHREVHVDRVTIATDGIEWRTAPASTPAIRYGDGVLTLDRVSLVSGAERIDANGVLGIATGTTSHLAVQATAVDLATLDRLLPEPRQLAGRMHASLRIVGPAGAPHIEGDLVVEDGAFGDFKFQSLASRIDAGRSGVTIDARLQQDPTAWIVARGYVPARAFRESPAGEGAHLAAAAEDAFDLRIETSTIDLGFVQGLTTRVTEATGTLQANVHVTGSGHDPHLTGLVEIRNGAFHVPATGVAYSALDARIDFKPDLVTVEQFRLADVHGHELRMSGQLAAHEQQIGTVNVQVEASQFEVLNNQYGEADADASLRLTGELLKPRLEGRVAIRSGRIQADEVLRRVTRQTYELDRPRGDPPAAALPLPAIVQTAGAPEAERRPDPLDALALDLRIVVPGSLVIRGANLRTRAGSPIGLGNINVTVGGDLRARKKPGETVRIVGTVNTVRGTYDFQGRRFAILRDGRIRFLGLAEIDPELDITGERVIAGVEARVHVRGSVRRPELGLSSQPPLDQADILSLIVFNRPANQLGEGERVSLAERAGALAGGFVVEPIVESLGRALDVDLLEFQTASDGGGPRITVGEQIGDRLFLKFSQQFGPRDISEFMLEYQLADFLRLQASFAEGEGLTNRSLTRRVERGGIDLIFFFSY